jgi:hypothetical protein
MRYTIRRIELKSIARLGCFLGWVIALFPAMLTAGLVAFVIDKVYAAFLQIKPFSLSLLGQEVLRVDLLNVLQLQPLQHALQPWAQNVWLTFGVVTLVLAVAGGAIWFIGGLLAGMFYNLIARLGLGLTLELVEAQRQK